MLKWIGCFAILLITCGVATAQQCTQTQLNSEFMSDPTARAYNTCAGFPNGNDQCVLDKFNAPCNNAACKVDQVVSRTQLYDVIDSAELDTLLVDNVNGTNAGAKRVRMLTIAMTNDTFNLANKETRDKLLDIFPAPSAPITNAAIVALQQKDAPRSTKVCNRTGTLNDVSCGLRGAGCVTP